MTSGVGSHEGLVVDAFGLGVWVVVAIGIVLVPDVMMDRVPEIGFLGTRYQPENGSNTC